MDTENSRKTIGYWCLEYCCKQILQGFIRGDDDEDSAEEMSCYLHVSSGNSYLYQFNVCSTLTIFDHFEHKEEKYLRFLCISYIILGAFISIRSKQCILGH